MPLADATIAGFPSDIPTLYTAGDPKRNAKLPGERTRDLIDVRDVASALLVLAEPNTPDGIYNVRTGRELLIRELLETFLAVSGLSPHIDLDLSRRSEVCRHFADVKRLGAVGFQARYPLISSVQSIWNYYEKVWSA